MFSTSIMSYYPPPSSSPGCNFRTKTAPDEKTRRPGCSRCGKNHVNEVSKWVYTVSTELSALLPTALYFRNYYIIYVVSPLF